MRLSDRGFLDHKWTESPDSVPPRHVYRLTAKGIAHAKEQFELPLVTNILGTIAGRFWGPTGFHVPLTLSSLLAWLPAAIVLHLMWVARPTPPIVPFAAI